MVERRVGNLQIPEAPVKIPTVSGVMREREYGREFANALSHMYGTAMAGMDKKRRFRNSVNDHVAIFLPIPIIGEVASWKMVSRPIETHVVLHTGPDGCPVIRTYRHRKPSPNDYSIPAKVAGTVMTRLPIYTISSVVGLAIAASR